MKTLQKSIPTRILCLVLSCLMIATLVPVAVLDTEADTPERQVWLYVPAGNYDTVEDAMSAMHRHTHDYDEIANVREDGVGVRITNYTEETVDVYPGFADNKLTDEIPSYDVGHMEYTFYGWQKMISVDGVLTGSDEYATYGSTLVLPAGTAVYAAVYLKRPKTYQVTFRGADGTPIPELSAGLIFGADLSAVKPTAEEEAAFVAKLPGYTFTFWGDRMQDLSKPKDDGADYFATHTTMGDETLTLWAHYKPMTFTVTYEVTDPYTGEVISRETREVTYGQPLSYHAETDDMSQMPADPSVPGYTFTGWEDSDGNGYSRDTTVTFLEDMTLTATFTPDDGQIFRAHVWYEDDTGAWVDSGLWMDFTGVTHETVTLTAHQRSQLLALLAGSETYTWHHEDEGVIVMPCTDPEGDPSVINVYFARKTFTLTVDGDGGHLFINGNPTENGVAQIPVYAGSPITLAENELVIVGADGVTYTFTVSRNAYEYQWTDVPEQTPAADCVISAEGTRLNVNVRIEIHLADLVIETENGEKVVYTQADLDDLNQAYAEAYERAAKRLSEALGVSLSVDDLRVSDLADETYKQYEAVVSEELAKVDPGYSGRAVNVYTADCYTLYSTVEAMADAGSLVSVDLVTHKGTPQYTVTYTTVDGTAHTLCEELYLLDDNELGFGAAAQEGFSVTVADDGTTVVSLCYGRNRYGFTPSVFFGDGQNATEKFEGIPGINELITCYGAPLQALAQMHIDDAHAAMEACGYGHEGYLLDEFATLYALHCKNTGALKDTYTWPAREYGLVIGEYVICSYELTVHYWNADKQPLSKVMTVTYHTPLSDLLTEALMNDMSVFGYDLTGFAYDSEGTSPVLAGDTMPAADTELWAVYTPKTIDLIFDAGATDATVPTPEGPLTVTFDAPVGILPETTRPGYVFDGWVYTDAEGSTVTVTAETVVDAVMLTAGQAHHGTLTLTAEWKEGPTTFTVQFCYRTLDGHYELDESKTLTNVPGITGQTALEAVLAYDEAVFATNVKPGFTEGARDDQTILLGNGSTVYQIIYDRLTYHLTVYANGVAPGAEGYAYGATLNGQGSHVATVTVSYVYGADLSGYMNDTLPYAAGYTVKAWQTVDWETILSLADDEHTVTEPIAYPLWETVKSLYTVDPTWGTVDVTVNGEAYGQIQYHYQNAYLPVGAEVTLTTSAAVPVAEGSLVFLGWVDLTDNTVISRERSITFTVTAAGISCKAVYVYLSAGATYHVYVNDVNGQLLWMGYETFDELDGATRDAFVAEANASASSEQGDALFTPDKGFTVISETDGIVWYQTNRG